MAPVTGPVPAGTYVVQNVGSSNYAALKDANTGSPITASNDAQSEDVKWKIRKYSNSKYAIISCAHATYAKVGANPNHGDPVVARPDDYQWDIKQTGRRGVYVISPSSDDQLYLGFANSNPNTNVKLNPDADDKSFWQFHRVTA